MKQLWTRMHLALSRISSRQRRLAAGYRKLGPRRLAASNVVAEVEADPEDEEEYSGEAWTRSDYGDSYYEYLHNPWGNPSGPGHRPVTSQNFLLTHPRQPTNPPGWVLWLSNGDQPPLPEPPFQGLTRLPQERVQTGLDVMVALLGMRQAHGCLERSPSRLLGLFELFAVFDLTNHPAYRAARELLGDELLCMAAVRWGGSFLHRLHQLLWPIRSIPALQAQAAYLANSLIEEIRQAVRQELQGSQGALVELADRLAEPSLALHGHDAVRLQQQLGHRFVRQHLDLPIAQRLFSRGAVWEGLLTYHFGVRAFKRAALQDPTDLLEHLAAVPAVPNSAAVLRALGDRLAAHLLSQPLASRLPARGLAIKVRPRTGSKRSSRVFAQEVQPTSIMRALGLLAGVRHCDPGQLLFIRADEGDSEFYPRWPQDLTHLRAAAGYPGLDGVLWRLSEDPELASEGQPESAEWTRRCLLLLKIASGLESYALPSVPDIFTGLLKVSEVLTRRIGYDVRQHLNLLIEVAEHIREGKRVPTVSKSAQPFRLQLREATWEGACSKAHPEKDRLLALAQRPRAWAELYQAAQHTAFAAGYRPPVKERSAALDPAGNPSTVRLDGEWMAERLAELQRALLRHYNRRLSDIFTDLVVAAQLQLQANRDIFDRIRSRHDRTSCESFLELLVERIPDDRGALLSHLRAAMSDWLIEQGITSSNALSGTARLRDILVSPIADEPVARRMHKAFALSGSGYLRLIEIARRRAGNQWSPSGRLMEVELRPSRSLVDLFSSIYGEDCSGGGSAVDRLFHPHHLFYQIIVPPEERPMGYLSVLEVQRGEEKAILLDVLNPSGSLAVHGDDLLEGTVASMCSLAQQRGAHLVAFASSFHHVSNRQSLVRAAEAKYGQQPLESGFLLAGGGHFQSMDRSGTLRVIRRLAPPAG